MYSNRWNLDFDLNKDVLFVVLVWVKLPYLPLLCWNDENLVSIGNLLRNYINKSERKPPMFACSCSCIEVDLEKGFPNAFNITIDGWTHLHKLAYE